MFIYIFNYIFHFENPTGQLLKVGLVKVNRFQYGSPHAEDMLVLTLSFPTHKSVLKHNIWQ